MWLTCTVINMQGNNYYMVEGALMCGSFFWKVEGSSAHTHESRAAHMWQLTCMVITTLWWRGALRCGSGAW